MNLLDKITGNNNTILSWGDALALWDIARYKITGLHVLSIFYKQSKDETLKKFIYAGVYLIVGPHISKLQKILRDEGFTTPTEPNWEEKFNDKDTFPPNILITDEEIALSLREILRMGLAHEAFNNNNCIRTDIKKVLDDIYNQDNTALDKLLDLQKKKNWLAPSPNVKT